MIAVEDQFVSEFFVCDVNKEGMVFFYEIWNKIYQAVEVEFEKFTFESEKIVRIN